MDDVAVEDLLDDVNTDAMTPAWVCFNQRPEDLAREAYAGLVVDGERLFPRDALRDGNFEVIVSGYRKGVGSSRETAVQAEKWSGIRIAIAASFAPIHAANNVNQGVLMGDHALLRRLQDGEGVDLREFYRDYDPITQLIVQEGGLFPFSKAVARGEIELPTPSTGPRPMTMAEKILASRVLRAEDRAGEPVYVEPGDSAVVTVDGGYSHDFTSAQVHYFLEREYGEGYQVPHPDRFAVFRGPPHLRRRGAEDAAPRRQDRDPAGVAEGVRWPRRRAGLLGPRRGLARHLPRGGAREADLAGGADPGDRQPHVHGRLQQRPRLGGRRDRVRQPRLLRLHDGPRCPSRSVSSWWASCPRGSPPKT